MDNAEGQERRYSVQPKHTMKKEWQQKDIEYGNKRDSDSNNSSIYLSSTQATCKLLLCGDKLINVNHITSTPTLVCE